MHSEENSSNQFKFQGNVQTNDALDSLWRKVEADWDNLSAHDAFLRVVLDRSELGYAAQKYQSQLEVPVRKELAKKN